jgi:hypothetical protein
VAGEDIVPIAMESSGGVPEMGKEFRRAMGFGQYGAVGISVEKSGRRRGSELAIIRVIKGDTGLFWESGAANGALARKARTGNGDYGEFIDQFPECRYGSAGYHRNKIAYSYKLSIQITDSKQETQSLYVASLCIYRHLHGKKFGISNCLQYVMPLVPALKIRFFQAT